MQITLPWPPSVNSYFTERAVKSKKSGRWVVLKFPSTKGQNYRKQVAQYMLAYRVQNPCKTLTARLRVRIDAFPPDKRTRDLDNILKCLLDSLTYSHVYEDDSQIDDLQVIRGERVSKGAVRVTIEAI